MADILNYNRMSYMPSQKISEALRTKEWRQQCVDAIIGFGTGNLQNGRTSRQNKQVNYDLYNSKFDEADFEYVLNPYGNSAKYATNPVKMQNYNIIRSKIELLKGEEIKRPFNFFVKGVNGGAASAREARKKELILETLRARLYQELGIAAEEDEQGNVMELPDIEKYINSEFMDPREITANQILKYLLHQESLEMKFNQGWEHALISAEEFYYPGIINGEPRLRVVNPLDFEYDKDDDVKFIEDAQWCRETRYMSPGAILDTYGEFLSDTELDRLDNGNISNSGYGMQPGFAYSLDSFKAYENSSSSYSTRNQTGIQVVNVCWKSWKKIGFLRYIDESGNEQEEIVSDDFKMSKEMKEYGCTLEWRWINVVWEGTKIGTDIYVNIRELPNQSRNMSNPSECKLPYTGYVYNNTNSQATSIIDLVKPHQYTYMILWWRFEQELAKSKGKAFVMDLAQVPKSQGWSIEQWMYYFDNLGVAFINSMEEGREGDPNTVSKFNQFNSIDRGVSDSIRIIFEGMDKLEQQVSNLTGVSPQREAQTSPSESATANQNSIVQSSHITEPYFYFHNEVKKRVLTKLLECAKYAYKDGKKIHFIADEIYSDIINVDGEIFPDSDYGVFVTNSSKDNEIKQKIEGLFEIALQQEKTQLSDLIKVYNSNSSSEAAGILAKGEKEFNDRVAQQQQADRDNQKAISDAQIADAQAARENENMNAQLDRQNKLDVAALNTMKGKDGPSDLNGNGVPDASEQAKISLEIEKHEFSKFTEGNKAAAQAAKDFAANERAREKTQADLLKTQIEAMKFEREQNQQDQLNTTKQQVDVHKAKLEQAKLEAEIKFKQAELADKKEERKFKMKELEAKMTLEKFKANEKIKQDRLKAQEDIKAKREKTKADIAIKKQAATVSNQAKKAGIKTKAATSKK